MTQRTGNAVTLIDEGNALEEKGQMEAAMARYEAAVVADPQCARAHLNRGNILLSAGRPDEARLAYQLAVDLDPHYAAGHFNLGNLHFGLGEYHHALRCYTLAVEIKADFAAAFVAMANAYDCLGRSDEAAENYQRALAINPAYAEAHLNLGILAVAQRRHADAIINLRKALELRADYALAYYYLGLALLGMQCNDEAVESLQKAIHFEPTLHQAHYSLGMVLLNLRPKPRLENAAASLRRAAEIRPDFAKAHHSLGTALTNMRRLEEAEKSLRRALAIEPESAEILYDLSAILLMQGKSSEAMRLTSSAIGHTPTPMIKVAFANCAARCRFTISDLHVAPVLATAVREAWGMPNALCRPAVSLIMVNPAIADCIRASVKAWPVQLPKSELFGSAVLASLSQDPLLRAVLETAPVNSLEFEHFLTNARHALLETASTTRSPQPADIQGLQFYSSLARQCFINEYIFQCDETELLGVGDCRAKLVSALDAGAEVPPFLLLAVAAYFPLYTLPNPERLLAADVPDSVAGVLRQQIVEPLEEKSLRASIQPLTAISSGVSEDVRSQYEQNPYPRWVKLPMRIQSLRFNDDLRLSLPSATFTPLADDSEPQVLIAGCGTGSHPILVVQRFSGVRVLAVDLSLSSLSYAKRKTQELGITNIEYAQADILELAGFDRTFDIIESVGVLHHLADPFSGWRILLSRLRAGGFMSLGFYSEIARRNVVKAREFIADCGYESTAHDIRRFRRDLVSNNKNAALRSLTESADFYSTSDCRDLLFHVQEHRLTVAQIEAFIAECGLRFIGFELDQTVLNQYHARFSDDAAGSNLSHWARFEVDNPDIFAGMYRFWIQKKP